MFLTKRGSFSENCSRKESLRTNFLYQKNWVLLLCMTQINKQGITNIFKGNIKTSLALFFHFENGKLNLTQINKHRKKTGTYFVFTALSYFASFLKYLDLWKQRVVTKHRGLLGIKVLQLDNTESGFYEPQASHCELNRIGAKPMRWKNSPQRAQPRNKSLWHANA